MYTTYVLYSEKYDKIYIGFTSNLQQRLLSHNKLATKGWTIKFRPWQLIYHENHQTKQQAMNREKQLKSYQGRKFIRNLINDRVN